VKEADVWLINLIRDIWLKHTFYGYRKITAVLRIEHALQVNSKRVLRLMREVGIQASYPKPKLSIGGVEDKIYPYLLRDTAIEKINQVWMVDITYLKLGTKFVYLVALIDVYSRYIIGWNLSFELDTESCLQALNIALNRGHPEIVNSDQGCQFTSNNWLTALLKNAIKISMDGIGRYKDNIYIERFWRSIKYEAIYLNDYTNFTELYCGIRDYIIFYNEHRPHQSLGYLRPEDVYIKSMHPKKQKIVEQNAHIYCAETLAL
jgi:putative transposase